MLLSDTTITQLIDAEIIRIEPAPNLDRDLGACSLDLHLAGHLKLMRTTGWDEEILDPGWSIDLHPGVFLLATTLEHISLPTNIAGRLQGRSSLARLGLTVHQTAGTIDPGWAGQIVLELANVGQQPITLTYGMRICALAFEQLDQHVAVPYYAKRDQRYWNQTTPVVSHVGEESR